MEHFATSSVPKPGRLDYWNALASQTFSPMTIDPAREPFVASLKRAGLGSSMGYARVASSAARITARPDPGQDDSIFLLLQSRGESRTTQAGKEAMLGQGEMVLLLAAEAYAIEFTSANVTSVLKLPARRIAQRVGDLERLVARPVPSSRTALLLSVVDAMAGSEQVLHDPIDAETAADVAVELLALAYRPWTAADTKPGVQAAWIRRLCDHIKSNIGDPDLNVSAVADAFSITPRYVQLLFAGLGKTCSSYILERRLDLAAARLAAGASSARITDVAMDLGFNDLTHFGRAFRRRFGITPSNYRVAPGG